MMTPPIPGNHNFSGLISVQYQRLKASVGHKQCFWHHQIYSQSKKYYQYEEEEGKWAHSIFFDEDDKLIIDMNVRVQCPSCQFVGTANIVNNSSILGERNE